MSSLLTSPSLILLTISPHLVHPSTISISYAYLILFFLSSKHISSTYSNGSCSSLITISTIISYPTTRLSFSFTTHATHDVATPTSTLPLADSSTSWSNLMPITLPKNDLHLLFFTKVSPLELFVLFLTLFVTIICTLPIMPSPFLLCLSQCPSCT